MLELGSDIDVTHVGYIYTFRHEERQKEREKKSYTTYTYSIHSDPKDEELLKRDRGKLTFCCSTVEQNVLYLMYKNIEMH